MVKVLIASLIVGTVLAHFGISTDELIKTAGLSPERIEELARAGRRLGAAELIARLARDRAGLVRALPVPPAW